MYLLFMTPAKPKRTDLTIYKPKFSLKNPAKNILSKKKIRKPPESSINSKLFIMCPLIRYTYRIRYV